MSNNDTTDLDGPYTELFGANLADQIFDAFQGKLNPLALHRSQALNAASYLIVAVLKTIDDPLERERLAEICAGKVRTLAAVANLGEPTPTKLN